MVFWQHLRCKHRGHQRWNQHANNAEKDFYVDGTEIRVFGEPVDKISITALVNPGSWSQGPRVEYGQRRQNAWWQSGKAQQRLGMLSKYDTGGHKKNR